MQKRLESQRPKGAGKIIGGLISGKGGSEVAFGVVHNRLKKVSDSPPLPVFHVSYLFVVAGILSLFGNVI